MAETLQKLSPDRDLQCYFLLPSAVAALSSTSPNGYTISGAWRQQFDWAVVEWNRDDVFEHPLYRPLPDGDLSGLTLTYNESRANCIPIDSDLYPTVDWPNLRIWADDGARETVYRIPLRSYATPIQGNYQAASVQFTLSGPVTPGDYVGLSFLSEHYPYFMNPGDTPEFAIENIVSGVNAFSPTMQASASGATITLSYVPGQTASNSATGANGNRIGVYSYVSGAQTEQWDAPWKQLTDGTSPTMWQIRLPFASLTDPVLGPVPAASIRKLRWTYSADLQPAAYERCEFQVNVSNWSVTGSGRAYFVAGPGSRRIEDSSSLVQYQGAWMTASGNFSGGTIHRTSNPGDVVACSYTSTQPHSLYLGTRATDDGGSIAVSIDGQPAISFNLNIPGEDVLCRKRLGEFAPGQHSVVATSTGDAGTYFYFDFFELAIPTADLPALPIVENKMTLATDWDTEHCLAVAPERTAWLIDSLGFHGRVNHYVGALWFFELISSGNQYAFSTVTFTGSPDPNLITELYIGRTDQPASTVNTLSHLNVKGDSAESLATSFALLINQGYTAIWAHAAGNQLTVYSRSLGADGNSITLATSANTTNLTIATLGPTLSGGVDGQWTTDLSATPRLNRAVRDWSQSYFSALMAYGLDVTASFSMELQFGDPSPEAGIAQRYPSQAPVLLNTPSLQTNFSPTSIAFWQQVYADMAAIQIAAGLHPYLQFGEVQWWYFPDDGSGMPFYDAYTTATFQSQYGRPMQLIGSNTVDPQTVPQEAAFLPELIGAFTTAITAYVSSQFPNCRFEVLYPTDVNDTAFNQAINYPRNAWTAANLTCLKTESFTYTFERNLDASRTTIEAGQSFGFTASQRSHLVGISDSTTAWLKEARMAQANGCESVVLFALDQFCLIGYKLPLSQGMRRSMQFG